MKKTMLMLLGAVALTGCSHSTSHPDAAQLADRQFALIAVDGQPLPVHEGIKPGIRFSESLKVNGVICNRFFGQGSLDQGRLTVPMLASTQMLCADPLLNKWEQTLTVVLTKGAEVKLAGQALTLTGSGHTLEYKAQ